MRNSLRTLVSGPAPKLLDVPSRQRMMFFPMPGRSRLLVGIIYPRRILLHPVKSTESVVEKKRYCCSCQTVFWYCVRDGYILSGEDKKVAGERWRSPETPETEENKRNAVNESKNKQTHSGARREVGPGLCLHKCRLVVEVSEGLVFSVSMRPWQTCCS